MAAPRFPAAPAVPVASPSFMMPMQAPGTQVPADPTAPVVMMMPFPADSQGTQTGPQMFGAGFFWGLASSFAIGFTITAKRMYDGMKSSGDSLLPGAHDNLELGMLSYPAGRAGVPTMQGKAEIVLADSAVQAEIVLAD